jgi:hypothetical protein
VFAGWATAGLLGKTEWASKGSRSGLAGHQHYAGQSVTNGPFSFMPKLSFLILEYKFLLLFILSALFEHFKLSFD